MKKPLKSILLIGLLCSFVGCNKSIDESDYNSLQSNYEELQSRYNTLQTSYDNLDEKYKDLKRVNSDIKMENSKFEAMESLYESQEEKIKEQKEEIKELQKIKEDYKYLDYNYRIEKDNADTYYNYWMKCLDEHAIVYCNERSGIYHAKPNCSGLQSSIKMLIKEAEKDGYRSCQKCY